jgi:uncharacterized membrane protein (DUF485 family)
VILLTAGLIFIALLTNYIGRLLTGMFPKQFTELGEMFRNLLLVGLVALVVSIALDMMLFTGQFVYPLILGAVIMCAGVFIGYTLVRNIIEDHPEFASAAPCAKFALYLIFVTVGLGAIFANFPEAAHVLQNIAWGIAIAVGVMAAPIVYALYRRAVAERERCPPFNSPPHSGGRSPRSLIAGRGAAGREAPPPSAGLDALTRAGSG